MVIRFPVETSLRKKCKSCAYREIVESPNLLEDRTSHDQIGGRPEEIAVEEGQPERPGAPVKVGRLLLPAILHLVSILIDADQVGGNGGHPRLGLQDRQSPGQPLGQVEVVRVEDGQDLPLEAPAASFSVAAAPRLGRLQNLTRSDPAASFSAIDAERSREPSSMQMISPGGALWASTLVRAAPM